jgi:hypothetical protein
MATSKKSAQQNFPTRFTAIHWPGGDRLIITLDIGGFGGSFNTKRNATEFTVAVFSEENTKQVDWKAIDITDPLGEKEAKNGAKLIGYYQNALEFNSRNESLIFTVPKGPFRVDIKAFNPIGMTIPGRNPGLVTGALYATKAKGFSIYEGETLSDSSGGVGDLSAPRDLADTDPREVDPSSIIWGFPSSYVTAGESIPLHTRSNGMFFKYGVNSDDPSTDGNYDDVIRESKAAEGKYTKPDRNWKRTTKFFKPGAVPGYETVIFQDASHPNDNGADYPWTLYVVYKNSKLLLTTTNPTPPPSPPE